MNIKSSDLQPVYFSTQDLFWLVGIYEGEGCVRVPKKKRSEIAIQIAMIDRDIVMRIAVLLGNRRVGIQKRKHPKYNRKTMYRCQVSGVEAVRILLSLMPHLGKRRMARAKEAIAAYDGFESMPFHYKLSKQAAGRIRNMRLQGKKVEEIAQLFRVHKTTIYRVLKGIHWV